MEVGGLSLSSQLSAIVRVSRPARKGLTKHYLQSNKYRDARARKLEGVAKALYEELLTCPDPVTSTFAGSMVGVNRTTAYNYLVALEKTGRVERSSLGNNYTRWRAVSV